MYLKRAKSGKSSMRSRSVIHEPESVRLQKDIERLSQRLEYEKRESNYLDERISMMTHELSQASLSQGSKTQTVFSNSKKATLLMLEKKLEFEMIQLNEAKANNKKIRSTIDDYRLERLSYKRTLSSLSNDLQAFSQQARVKNLEYRRGGELDQEQRTKISALRCKSASDQDKHGAVLGELYSVLNEEKQERSKVFKMMEQEAKLNINRPIEGIEVSRILKQILARWSSKTKDKKKSLDQYMKHIKVVEDAFNQIKQATGIPSIEEIVTAFIKSQEQNYQIYTYMNNLNSEIDTLEDYLSRTKEKIRTMEHYKESGKRTVNEMHESLLFKADKLDNKTEKKQKEISRLRNKFQSVLSAVGKIQGVMESLPIHTQLNKTFEQSWLEDTNEENLMNSLGYIEEFINYMIILLAFARSAENALLDRVTFPDSDKKTEPKGFEIVNLLEEKDLVEDRELEDAKNPLLVSEFQSKALQIFEKKRNFSEEPRGNSVYLNKLTNL